MLPYAAVFDDGARARIAVGSVADPTDLGDVVYNSDWWRSRIRVVRQMVNEKSGLPIKYDEHGDREDYSNSARTGAIGRMWTGT